MKRRNQLALVYSTLGFLTKPCSNWRRGVAVNPSNTVARFCHVGEILLFQGKYEEALTALRSVPKSINHRTVGHQIVWALFNLGRKDEAAATLAQFLKDYQRTIVDSIRAWRRCLQRQQARNVWLRKNQFGNKERI